LAAARFCRSKYGIRGHEPNAAQDAVELHKRFRFFQRTIASFGWILNPAMVHFHSIHKDAREGVETQPDLPALKGQHLSDNRVADHNGLANRTRENPHR
jgi:hypothetical protein